MHADSTELPARLRIFLTIAAIAAAVFGATQPTGTGWADAVWRGLVAFGFGFGLATIPSNARRATLFVLIPVASIPIGLATAVLALALEVAAAPTGRHARPGSAFRRQGRLIVASVLGIATLFSLTDRWVGGSAAIAATASLLIVTVVSVARWPSPVRRRAARMAVAPALATGAIGLLYGAQMAGHAPDLLGSARQIADDPEQLDRGTFAAQLARARTTADRWYFRPLDAVPVASQNVGTVRGLLSAGDDIAGAVTLADTHSTGDATRQADDVTQMIVDVCAGVDRLAHRIDAPGSGLLVPPLRSTVDRVSEFRELIEQGAGLCPAAPHLSTLAGFDGDRSHLVLFATTAEARGTIGLITNWARISASEGSLSLEDSGRSIPMNDLLTEVGATVTLPTGTDRLWGRFDPAKYFQDVSLSPSGPAVADAAADLYAQAFPDHPPDGVLIIGPQAIAAVVGLCSGIDVGDVQLDASNTVDFLTRDQYVIDLTYGQRVEMLQTILDSLFAKISSGGCGVTPDGVGGLLDAVSAGEVVYVPRIEAMRDDFLSTPLVGELPLAKDAELFGVIEQNAGLDKLDAYLERDTTLTWSDGSSAQPLLRLNYTNDAPEILPDYVLGLDHGSAPPRVNRRRVSIYAPALISSVSFTTAESTEPTELEFYSGFERGHRVSTFLVDIQPDTTTEIIVTFEDWDAPSNGLTILRPPAIRSGAMVVAIGDDEHTVTTDQRISMMPGS